MKQLLLLPFFLCSLVAVAQNIEDLEKINSIKLNSDYVYGESTMENESDAKEVAFDYLFSNLRFWVEDNKANASEKASDREAVKGFCSSITVPRGSMQRVFLYFELDSVKINIEPKLKVEEVATIDEPVVAQQATRPPTSQEIFENELKALTNVDQLLEFVAQEKYFNRCQYGEVNADVLKRIDIKKRYLLLYVPKSGEITALLSYYHNGRIDLKKGRPDSTTNHKGCRAIWVKFYNSPLH